MLDALLLMPGGDKGKVWALRQWELETINHLGWTESAWIRLSLDERYRKVCSHKLAGWQQALATEESIRKARAKSGNG